MARQSRIKRINPITFEEAIQHTKKKGTKFVWLGVEPAEYMSKVLKVEDYLVTSMRPEEIIYANKDKLSQLKDHVLVCYHGNTSGFLADYLNQNNVEAYHLKDGIVSVVGDIF